MTKQAADLTRYRWRLLQGMDWTTGCWLWTRPSPSFHVEDATVTPRSAAYRIFIGPIEKGTKLFSICGTEQCCNPYHQATATPPELRFLAMVRKDASTGCWTWTGATNDAGYGRFDDYDAHRASYIFFVGDPGDLHVLHECDNKGCVNPTHLRLGTAVDNAEDHHAKKRRQKPGIKITEPDVYKIADRLSEGASRAEIAEDYDVTPGYVSNLMRGRLWQRLNIDWTTVRFKWLAKRKPSN